MIATHFMAPPPYFYPIHTPQTVIHDQSYGSRSSSQFRAGPPAYYDHRSQSNSRQNAFQPGPVQFGEFGELDSRSRSQSRGRWSNSSGVSWNEEQNRGRYGHSIGRQEVSQNNATSDHDHPSFHRPPHRPNGGMPLAIDLASLTSGVEYELVPNTSVVPPPPPIERSAVPLADLATEMVWQACLAAELAEHPAPASMQWTSALEQVVEHKGRQRTTSSRSDEQAPRSSPRTPELYFGAIGEGRQQQPGDGCASDNSSPANSAPGTPADHVGRKGRLGGLGFAFGFEDDKANVELGGFETPIEAIRIHARKLSTLNRGLGAPALASEPSAAFRQFVKQVLTTTLVAPEDLVLALYYVAHLPSASMVPPTAASRADGMDARANAVKAAPFKLILGALMLANKTLQDNSYRNETFAAVSGIPLKDVNALEVFVFGALNFDVAVHGDVWARWLHSVVDQHEHYLVGDTGDRREVSKVLQRLVQATQLAMPVPVAYKVPSGPSTPVQPSAGTTRTPERSHLLAGVNFDHSGPLRSPTRFDDTQVERQYFETESPSRSSHRVSTHGYRGDLKSDRSFVPHPLSYARNGVEAYQTR